MKHLLTSAALAIALAGCAQPAGWGYVGSALLLPDGHSNAALISGSVCADPNCLQQDTVTGDVVTSYDRYGRLTSVVQDVRPVVAPAGALAWGQVLIPAAATVGAGALIRAGEIGAGQIESMGNVAAAAVNGREVARGLENEKPAVNTNINTVAGSTATASAGSVSTSAASASASAKQSQIQLQGQQQQQKFSPSILVVNP